MWDYVKLIALGVVAVLAAIAANYLSRYGKVALLDVDYHHGNGSQDIFYKRSDVLTVSIHGHPRDTYPFFSGFDKTMRRAPPRRGSRRGRRSTREEPEAAPPPWPAGCPTPAPL